MRSRQDVLDLKGQIENDFRGVTVFAGMTGT